MEKKHIHISLLTTLLFVFGFQFFGNQATLHAAVSTHITTSHDVDTFQVHKKDKITIQSLDHQHIQILSEIGEETPEEEQENTTTSTQVAVSHTFYSSYLRFATKKVKCQKPFDKSVLLSTTPIYLFFEVFRL